VYDERVPPRNSTTLKIKAFVVHGVFKPQIVGHRERRKITPIFLPFRKTAVVKSAAPGMMDNIIEAKELQIERKHFYVELRENDRGKFLRITEEAHGRRNSIIVPSTGVDDFTAAISEILANNGTATR
jgi:hypothetical protein